MTLIRNTARRLVLSLVLLVVPAVAAEWEPNETDLQKAVRDGAFTTYFTNLSIWMNRKVPVTSERISEDVLRPLLADRLFRNSLDQYQFIAKIGVKKLEVFAQENAQDKEFLAWLLSDIEALDEYLLAAVPIGSKQRAANYTIPVGSLAIWRRILEADPDAKHGLYLRLAIATALRPPGTGNRGAGMQATPSDPVVRYQYFKSAYRNGELFPVSKRSPPGSTTYCIVLRIGE